MLYDGELDHQHQNLENEVTNTRRDLAGANARLVEVDNELGAVRADLTTARHALVELDDMLTALRAEHDAFKQHAEAEFARLAGETEADKPPAPATRKRKLGPLDILDAFRTVTGWSDAEVLHYESECDECDPFASIACDRNPAVIAARAAEETASARWQCGEDTGTAPDCPNPVAWIWRHDGEQIRLCDEHAADKDLSDLEDLAGSADQP